MNNRIIIGVIIILLVVIGGVGALFLMQEPEEPLEENLTINETTVVVNESGTETPQTNITAAQARKIAEESSADLGFPGVAGTTTLFRWTEEFQRDWDPADKNRTWVWNVSMTYSTGSVREGSLYVDAQTGEIIMN
ncbi:MAG: PepSY domain-containing protein [Euryarchaeota archaeon]|nr:PepSY domain-containing protein [Euryarchaeota archaeon]MBV1729930.1 PepSY domain-containing protein [Methanobacterium sp.]MBV1754891.1 PepSY domain-containing protein [Methanobacterium sp.]